MGQFEKVIVERCINCGRIYRTHRWAALHAKHCIYTESVISGQIGLFDDPEETKNNNELEKNND